MAGVDVISNSTGKEIVAAIQSTDVAQARISEINQAAELKKNEVLESIPEDYSSVVNDVNQLKGDTFTLGEDQTQIKAKMGPIDFRLTSTKKVVLDVDVTGTMEALIDGMEQEPAEAIALMLEPKVPTADVHNFGVRGQICIDDEYLYVCTKDNEWKKIALLAL